MTPDTPEQGDDPWAREVGLAVGVLAFAAALSLALHRI